MIHLLYALLATARSSLKSQREFALENLALRQQLAVLKRATKRPKLTNADRAFWVVEAAVSRYMPRRRKPPPQTWRSFFRNHTQDLVSIDFFVVPTATFRILYVFLVLEHERRRIVRFNVTGGRPPSGQVSNR